MGSEGTQELPLAPHCLEDKMDNVTNQEFKDYLRSYCSDTGVKMPLWGERMKLCTEFNKVKYSDQMDTECALWEFLDNNLMKKKDMIPNGVSICSINYATPCTATSLNWCKQACKKEEKEDTMIYNETEASRKYLNGRLQDTRYALRAVLDKQFNISASSQPNNYKQLIDAIKNDNYTLNAKRTAQIDPVIADGDYYGSPFDGITWTYPGLPDFVGYTAAEKALEKAATVAKDTVNTGDAAAGLAALQAFEAWTFVPTSA